MVDIIVAYKRQPQRDLKQTEKETTEKKNANDKMCFVFFLTVFCILFAISHLVCSLCHILLVLK